MEWPWIRLKRLIGASGTPADTQEGQIRYTRDGAVDGAFKVARKLSGGTNEWQNLSDKAAAVHTHAESDVTSLVSDLSTLTTAVAGKAATVHTHAEADVTSLVADLALKAPLSSPTFTGTVTTAALTANGNVAIGDAQSDTATITAHLAVAGADPTITTTPAASYPGSGTTPGAVSINGNDTAMLITYDTGTGATAGDMFKVAFATARPGSAYVVLVQCMNNGSSQVQPYITGRATTDFTVVAKVAPPSSTSIQFGILVIDV